jgi:hypothetical protein
MGNKKSKVLNYGYLDWRLWRAKIDVRKRMHCFPEKGLRAGKTPPDLNATLTTFFVGLDVPDLLLDASSAAQNMRLDLVRLILTYPEFAAAAIYSVFVAKPDAGKRKSGVSPSSLVREFLLTEATVVLPDGKRVSQVGASDGEIALAIAKKYGVSPSVKMVKNERTRLEKICGSSVAALVDFILKTTEELDLLWPGRTRGDAREARRAEAISCLYEQA